ncbi:hypothetical protein GCM10010435_49050 [Winogradskya consettensis]|uniref:Knr4/Smi1-like domain-containing protein n=1 Tax=Winogradskya consettensis TaxID=113560 RepID=A0A919SJG6_9ACTN|nr:SMI1/KNR4 family protein [Actinoplanes consettensis]GIM73171.1 hypothetical protein Aco04nite_33980 [Actinoplanes consettensis]
MTAPGEWSGIADLLRRVPVPVPPGAGPVLGATDEQIASIAGHYESPLPDVYVRWLRFCNGTPAGPGGLYGAGTSWDGLDALRILQRHPCWATLGWIPVAGDGNGNTYILDTDAVYFVEAMDESEPAYTAAGSLPVFLRFLLEKELGETRWPFDAAYVTAADPGILSVTDSGLLPWLSW